MIRSRKKAVVGFVAGLLVLAVGSVASACTVWIGQFAVSTDGPDAGTTKGDGAYEKVTTYGSGVGMNHCWMAGAVKVHVGAPHTTSSIAIDYKKIQPVANPLDPAYEANVACAVPSAQRAPKDGWYTVSYLNTGFGEYEGGNVGGNLEPELDPETWEVDRRLQRVYVRDCMAFGGHPKTWQQQTTSDNDFQVTGGAGTWAGQIRPKPTAEIPDLPGTESAICVQQAKGTYSGAPDGGQAPIIVI